jgi:hypothetical protein
VPAPVSYTEATLKTYMVAVLSSTAGALGLTVASDAIVQAVTAVERVLGVTDVASLTDMPAKLEAIASWKAWSAAEDSAMDAMDLKAGTAAINRSALYDHITKRLARAEAEASIYSEVQTALAGSGGVATVSSLGGVSNPYGWQTYSEWG